MRQTNIFCPDGWWLSASACPWRTPPKIVTLCRPYCPDGSSSSLCFIETLNPPVPLLLTQLGVGSVCLHPQWFLGIPKTLLLSTPVCSIYTIDVTLSFELTLYFIIIIVQLSWLVISSVLIITVDSWGWSAHCWVPPTAQYFVVINMGQSVVACTNLYLLIYWYISSYFNTFWLPWAPAPHDLNTKQRHDTCLKMSQ